MFTSLYFKIFTWDLWIYALVDRYQRLRDFILNVKGCFFENTVMIQKTRVNLDFNSTWSYNFMTVL
jgi:hypothetical protein